VRLGERRSFLPEVAPSPAVDYSAIEERILALQPKKGDWGGECNRTVCKETPATFYNRGTYRYYCRHCAHLINLGLPRLKPLCFEAVLDASGEPLDVTVIGIG
jgi:hypothetical protein